MRKIFCQKKKDNRKTEMKSCIYIYLFIFIFQIDSEIFNDILSACILNHL